MKIDAQTGWFRGLGDIVCFAWLGEGMLQTGQDVEFFATDWREEVFRMFQLSVTHDPTGAVVTQMGYEKAMSENSPMNYIEWIAHHHGIKDTPPVRPRLDLIPMDREMGRRDSGDVLIFPYSHSPSRTWPKAYFVELGLILRDAGFKVKFVTEQRDYAFWMPFHCIVGASWNYIAAAMQSAQLVIGNDSGPAHLSGTIGTPAIAIQGPTTERIYSYVPQVICLRMKNLKCAGCHCLLPLGYRASCEVACIELYRTLPEDVAYAAMAVLEKPDEQAA